MKCKILAYEVVRMEEDEEGDTETFWMHCASFCKSFRICYIKYNLIPKEEWKISEIAREIHKRLLFEKAGEYSTKERYVGNHQGTPPEYIEEHMYYLDLFYKKNHLENNIEVAIYFFFEKIHPFSDGNGRIGKAILALLENKIETKIKTKNQHKKLCKHLNIFQKKCSNYFEKKNDYYYIFENYYKYIKILKTII